MIKKYYNNIIPTVIVLIFGFLSIQYKNIIAGIAHIYLPICLIFLLLNLNNKNFKLKLILAFGLIILNEFLIRILGDISLNSDGNPWASILFLLTLLTSYITIIISILINKKTIETYLSLIVYSTIAFLFLLILYIFIFLI